MKLEWIFGIFLALLTFVLYFQLPFVCDVESVIKGLNDFHDKTKVDFYLLYHKAIKIDIMLEAAERLLEVLKVKIFQTGT